VLMLIVVILFGAKRLPELGRSFGQFIREFRNVGRAITDDVEPEKKA
jgi:sec-independent protein translocase protein TatA